MLHHLVFALQIFLILIGSVGFIVGSFLPIFFLIRRDHEKWVPAWVLIMVFLWCIILSYLPK